MAIPWSEIRGPVRDDVEQGYVSRQAAREHYGVVVFDGAVDEGATQQSREQHRAGRIHLKVIAVARDTLADNARLWDLAPEVAARLEVEDGDVVECVAPGTAPLRGRVRIRPGQIADHLPTGPFALRVFRICSGDQVWVRKLYNPMQSELGITWPPRDPAQGVTS